MKRINIKSVVTFIILLLVSCDEPETTVTNFVHPDGSVTRVIEMRSTKNNFEKDKLQVPVDSTWNIRDSIETGAGGDTTWVKRAVKVFRNPEELNAAYKTDPGANHGTPRSAAFERHFHWFSTKYRFSETVEAHFSEGYPVSGFLNAEELKYFYTPDKIKAAREFGPDSLKYKKLSEAVEKKGDEWMINNIVAVWTREFVKLIGPSDDPVLSYDSLKSRSPEMAAMIIKNEHSFDSLWAKGLILNQFIGDSNAVKYKAEADSAISLGISVVLPDFKDYEMRIVMPGRLTATNGYIDSSMVLRWTVKSDYFIADRYVMWAESKTTNLWAWIVSGLFLLFVAAGIIIKRKSR